RVVLGILERDGVRLLGGDPATADAARTRIDAIEAKLALLADQFVADTITGDQLTRATAPLREQLDAERVRLSAAQPDAGLADYVGPTAAAAWAKADVETRKHIIRAIGMRITINRVGAGNGREYDPESVTIAAA
ncbi:MAG: hypothetical protein JO214_17320, partial [Frankiaceae bacterium]|nr:hypothetical protein [Frankiaceae bacterium]